MPCVSLETSPLSGLFFSDRCPNMQYLVIFSVLRDNYEFFYEALMPKMAKFA